MAATLAATAAAALPKSRMWLTLVALALELPRRAVLGTAAAAAASSIPAACNADAPRSVIDDVKVPFKGGPITIRRMKYTGAGDPAWTYSKTELSKQLYSELPAAWPYAAADFKRLDEEDDSKFYPEAQPKLVYHVDEGAVAALTRYYEALNLKRGADVLDICSSWVSHYPKSWPKLAKSIVGTGISATELACNDQLSSFVARDLNNNPALPFADASFDVVTCVVSFDYLTKPREVMAEVARVLRPGGRVVLSQSNRCFFTKAVKAWTADMSDAAHLRYLGTLVTFTDGLSAPRAFDVSARGPGTNDPMYIVEATRV